MAPGFRRWPCGTVSVTPDPDIPGALCRWDSYGRRWNEGLHQSQNCRIAELLATIAADRRAHANLKRQVGVAVAHPYEESDNRLIGIVKAFIGADRRRIEAADALILNMAACLQAYENAEHPGLTAYRHKYMQEEPK